MSQNLGSLSFLSRFDPSEFYEIAKDLPSTLELSDPDVVGLSGGSNEDAATTTANSTGDMVNMDENNNNIEIIGTHLLVPQSSIMQMIESNKALIDSTIIDFDSLQNVLPQTEASIPAASNLPSYETFSGLYDFRIFISSSDKPVKKSASWTYSSKLNKLYSIPGVACPVEMSVSSMPPFGSIIRAMPIFSKLEHIQDLVTRCENHKKSKEFNSDDFPEQSNSHFVRCRHSQAAYTQDMSTLRESVCIPFERPTTMKKWSDRKRRGGRNLRPLPNEAVRQNKYAPCHAKKDLTSRNLEIISGEILGRTSFEVKICACPGRDRTTDEKKLIKDEPKTAAVATATKNTKDQHQQQPQPKVTTTSGISDGNAIEINQDKIDQINIKSICLPSQKDGEEVFTIKVKGRKNYEILKNLNEALEIQRRIHSKMKISDESLSGILKKGSSFLFNNSQPQTKTKAEVTEEKLPKTLEEFLNQIDMDAYYNLIAAKGIKTIDDLLEASKKKINSLKISERDTQLLWAKIEHLRSKTTNKSDHNEDLSPERDSKKPKTSSHSFNSRQPSLTNNAQATPTDDYVKLSKYQIRYSSFKKQI